MRSLLLIFFMSLSSHLFAHNMPVSIAEIVFHDDGSFDIELRFDVDSNMGDLISAEGDLLALSIQYSRARFNNAAEAEIKALADIICGHVCLQFDSVAVRPHLTELDLGDPSDITRVHVARFHGQAPKARTRCHWQAHPILKIVHLQIKTDGIPGTYVEVVQNYSASGIYAGVPSNSFDIFTGYLISGMQHIIPKGLDHILFIIGLFFVISSRSSLLWQVTAFTVAHSITLGLVASGWLLPPTLQASVEPIIALSIAYIAIETCLKEKMTKSRPLIVFLFGLIHGMGFAGVLGNVGLPHDYFGLALLSFNVGVECAQIAIIAVCAALFWPLRNKTWYRKAVVLPICLGIAVTGLWMFVERVF